jgi:uncharacterized integral membrane protein (TIGR00697 family)
MSPAKTVLALAALHSAVILASNYLVQIPVQLGSLLTTWGAFTFPIVFLATDLSVRVLGAPAARRVVAWAMLPALLASYIVSVLFAEGRFAGWESLQSLNLFVLRIALASLAAYVVGQVIDIHLFARLQRHGPWWLAPAVSTVVGSAIDTLVFFGAAFHASPDPFMAQHWPEIAAVDYATKILVSLAFYLPVYAGLMRWLLAHVLPPLQPSAARSA